MPRIRLISAGLLFFIGVLIFINSSIAMSIPVFVISANLFLWGELYKMLWVTFIGLIFITFFYFGVFEILGEMFNIINPN